MELVKEIWQRFVCNVNSLFSLLITGSDNITDLSISQILICNGRTLWFLLNCFILFLNLNFSKRIMTVGFIFSVLIRWVKVTYACPCVYSKNLKILLFIISLRCKCVDGHIFWVFDVKDEGKSRKALRTHTITKCHF